MPGLVITTRNTVVEPVGRNIHEGRKPNAACHETVIVGQKLVVNRPVMEIVRNEAARKAIDQSVIVRAGNQRQRLRQQLQTALPSPIQKKQRLRLRWSWIRLTLCRKSLRIPPQQLGTDSCKFSLIVRFLTPRQHWRGVVLSADGAPC